MTLLTSVDLASRCAGDGEFQLAGHFAMSENPAVFLRYLLPVLDLIKGRP
jgi:hypothetical protein